VEGSDTPEDWRAGSSVGGSQLRRVASAMAWDTATMVARTPTAADTTLSWSRVARACAVRVKQQDDVSARAGQIPNV
jgi:hypothetical protein